jgi:hypothetical protein
MLIHSLECTTGFPLILPDPELMLFPLGRLPDGPAADRSAWSSAGRFIPIMGASSDMMQCHFSVSIGNYWSWNSQMSRVGDGKQCSGKW